jgi:hypothetical protein
MELVVQIEVRHVESGRSVTGYSVDEVSGLLGQSGSMLPTTGEFIVSVAVFDDSNSNADSEFGDGSWKLPNYGDAVKFLEFLDDAFIRSIGKLFTTQAVEPPVQKLWCTESEFHSRVYWNWSTNPVDAEASAKSRQQFRDDLSKLLRMPASPALLTQFIVDRIDPALVRRIHEVKQTSGEFQLCVSN